MSLKDILAYPEERGEVDSSIRAKKHTVALTEGRITRRELEERITQEREAFQAKLEEVQKAAEAEKLALMSESKREEYKRDKALKELEQREQAVAKRELMADAFEMLDVRDLPRQLAVCLDYSSKEACERSLGELEKAFNESVTIGINSRIRGVSPSSGSAGATDAFLAGLGYGVEV